MKKEWCAHHNPQSFNCNEFIQSQINQMIHLLNFISFILLNEVEWKQIIITVIIVKTSLVFNSVAGLNNNDGIRYNLIWFHAAHWNWMME